MTEYSRFVNCLKIMGIEFDVADCGSKTTHLPIMIVMERFDRIMSWWFDAIDERLLDVSIDFIFAKKEI